MWRNFIYLAIILGLLAGAFYLVTIAPYHIYTLTLTEGVNTRFLSMKPTKKSLYDGEALSLYSLESMKDQSLYETFHFSHFQIPFPVNHSLYNLIPAIKFDAKGLRLGAHFQNGRNIDLFSFQIERPYKLEANFGEQQLFLLPIFKNYIQNKPVSEIWADLFQKKLSLPSNEGKSFFESLKELKKVSYSDLVYQLYILFNRHQLFPEETLRLSYFTETTLGVVELPSEDDSYITERLYILKDGIIYPIIIKTRKFSDPAKGLKEKFVNEVRYKNSTPDDAISIYAKYKQLSYNKRLEEEGMGYLFAAWSHDLNNKDFVRVIILFLERGKSNLKFLKPFYEYAYKKFGSTLSAGNEFLTETPTERLRRQEKEELYAEIEKEKEQALKKTEELNNPDEKIKYYLQKAKDEKINSDDKNKVLSIE